MRTLTDLQSMLAPPRMPVWKRLIRWTLGLCLLSIVVLAGYAGWELRPIFFEKTETLRFPGDINNGFSIGMRVINFARSEAGQPANSPQPLTWRQFLEAYLKAYDRAAARARVEGGVERYSLDYAPLRLLVMSAWVKQVKAANPQARRWREEYTPFMLRINRGIEAAGAILIAGLVWMVMRQTAVQPIWLMQRQESARIFRSGDKALIAAAFAGLIFWFNPSTLLNTHGWPQWDLWLIPFYLLAMIFAIRGHFFAAGAALAVGALLKGQILLAAPVFLLWAIFQARPGRAAMLLLGFACGMLICASAWLAPTREAWVWIACVIPVAAAFASTGKAKHLGWSWWLAATLAVGLIAWPWLNPDHVMQIYLPLLLAGGMMVLPLWLPRRAATGIFAICVCATLAISASRFDGSWNWFRIGYMWPTYQHFNLTMGHVCNLPSLLQTFGWTIYDVVFRTDLPLIGGEYTTRHALAAMYAVTIVLCGIGAAIQSRRNDPRIVIALIAPWILSFALLSQMHERYLVWGAALAGAGIAVSVGMSLLQFVLIGISASMMLHDMIYVNDRVWPEVANFIDKSHVGMSWVVLLLAAIYLYQSLAPSRKANLTA